MPPMPKRQVPSPIVVPAVRQGIERYTEAELRALPIVERIRPIGTYRNKGFRILIYGAPGTGKTTLWATWPKPILVVVCSGGKKSEETDSINTPEYRKVIHETNLYEVMELRDIIEYARVSGNYQTLIIDHLNGVQDLSIKGILGLDVLPEQKTFKFADRKEWGDCAYECKQLLRPSLDLNMNLVWVCGEKLLKPKEEEGVAQDEEVGVTQVTPSLTPSLAGWCEHSITYMAQTYTRPKREYVPIEVEGAEPEMVETVVKGMDYMLRVEPDGFHRTKFRIPRGHAMKNIVDPSYDKVHSLIMSARQ